MKTQMTKRLFSQPTILFTLAFLTFMNTSNAQNNAPFPAPKNRGDAAQAGQNIQRAMALMDSGTQQKPNTVRVLFYGQSITEGDWWKAVASDLKERFPNANFVIENRALGGFSSQRLVHTAEADLYSFYPDLLIFHVYGAHDDYEKIIQRTRARTTADILIQNDHLRRSDKIEEDTDPAQVKNFRPWDAFFNFVFLPSMAQKYNTGLLNQRALWKSYLQDNNLTPGDLLKDDVHPNAHGNFLMSQLVSAYLVRRPDEKIDPYNCDTVKTLVIGKDVFWEGDKLRVPFEGNRVDAIIGNVGKSDAEKQTASVVIDGKKPSQHTELYGFTRALSTPGGKWPVILKVGFQTLPLLEDWTLQVTKQATKDTTKDAAHDDLFHFALQGSQTGADGEGTSNERFVSKSGRVVIEPGDWDVKYALDLPGIKTVPDNFTVKWQTVAHFSDTFAPRANNTANNTETTIENAMTLAQGLKNGAHVLEISGGPQTSLVALRIYRPPLEREEAR